jgi:hypothetical protein
LDGKGFLKSRADANVINPDDIVPIVEDAAIYNPVASGSKSPKNSQ